MNRQLLRQFENPVRTTQTSMEKIREIAELSEKQLSRPDIAREVEVSKQTVYKYQKAMGYV